MTRSSKEELPVKKNPSRKSKNIRLITVIQCSNDQKFKVLKEKNRESAQRSRDNRKKYVVSLENRISELTLENDYFRKQLSLCHCSRQEASVDNNITHATTSEQDKIIDESVEPSLFERVSIKSYTSCSNFLLLSIVALFCIFGCVDVTGDSARQHTGLYSMSSLQTALTHWSSIESSCDSHSVPQPPNPLRYMSLEKAEAYRNGIRPALNESSSTIQALVQEQLQRNITLIVNA